MKRDEDLQIDVLTAIQWEPLLSASQIGVMVNNGIVTLTGNVDNYAKKAGAEDAVKKVSGVKALVEKIEVHFGSNCINTDNKIASDILNSFKNNGEVLNDRIKLR